MSTDQQGTATSGEGQVEPEAGEEALELALADPTLAASFGEYARAWWKRVRGGDTGVLPVIAGLILIVVIFESQSPTFLHAGNLVNLLEQASYYVVFGMAEVFVLLLGEIDLSTGFVAACGASITLILSSQLHNVAWWPAILAGLTLCALAGLGQGLLITRLRLPSFVVTLGGLLAFEGFLLFILGSWSAPSSGETVSMSNSILVDLDNGRIDPTAGWIIGVLLIAAYAALLLYRDRSRRSGGLVTAPLSLTLLKIAGVAAAVVAVVAVCNINTGIRGGRVLAGVPWALFIIVGVGLATTFLLGRTRFGRYVYAVGGNAEAARRAGINLTRIRVLCFTICGLLAGVAGMFYASFIQSISPSVDGGSLVLYAVAAAVIGGTSLFGGRGKIVHAVLGGLVIATIANGLGLLNINTDGQDIVTALVLVVAATVDALARRNRTAS
jgi:D-xylose transport system permease protein